MNVYSSKITEDTMIDLMKLDPTGNNCTYIDFIFKQYLLGIKEEDYYKITDVLREFNDKKHKLPPELRDIGKYKTYQDLTVTLDEWFHRSDENITEIISEDIKIIYQGRYGSLSVPLTEEASCKLGKGTKWCTASDLDSRFEYYNDQGELYVWIDKNWNSGRLKELGNKSKKFQFHFNSVQFMDELDMPIKSEIFKYFRNEHPILSTFIHSKELLIDPGKSELTPEHIRYLVDNGIESHIIYDKYLMSDRTYSLNMLSRMNSYSWKILGCPSYLDDFIDQDDTLYLRRCIANPLYVNDGKVFNDNNVKNIYYLIILKDVNANISDPIYMLYYATYVIRKRIPELNDLNYDYVEYIDLTDLVEDYLFMYGNITDKGLLDILELGNYIFDTDMISVYHIRDHHISEFYALTLGHDVIYNLEPLDILDTGFFKNNMLNICSIANVRNKFLDNNLCSLGYSMKVLHGPYINDFNTVMLERSTKYKLWFQEASNMEEFIDVVSLRYPTENEFNLFKDSNVEDINILLSKNLYMTYEQLVYLFKTYHDQSSTILLIFENLAKFGYSDMIVVNKDVIEYHMSKVNDDIIANLSNIWHIIYHDQPSERMEKSLLGIKYKYSHINDSSMYYKYVTKGIYVERIVRIPIYYLIYHPNSP